MTLGKMLLARCDASTVCGTNSSPQLLNCAKLQVVLRDRERQFPNTLENLREREYITLEKN